jgi:hypothetical protein
MLTFLYITNHTCGGVNGEGYKQCSQLLAFLASPFHRMVIQFAAAMYPTFLKWSAFLDGKSATIYGAQVISTRLSEAAVFERNQLEFVCSLNHDWHTVFPGTWDLACISSRGRQSGAISAVFNCRAIYCSL